MGQDFAQLIPATVLAARNLSRLSKEVVQDVYDYWKKKRLAVGKPLIGRLQTEEEEIRHSSSYVRTLSLALPQSTVATRTHMSNILFN
jgi:hypothetical protein